MLLTTSSSDEEPMNALLPGRERTTSSSDEAPRLRCLHSWAAMASSSRSSSCDGSVNLTRLGRCCVVVMVDSSSESSRAEPSRAHWPTSGQRAGASPMYSKYACSPSCGEARGKRRHFSSVTSSVERLIYSSRSDHGLGSSVPRASDDNDAAPLTEPRACVEAPDARILR